MFCCFIQSIALDFELLRKTTAFASELLFLRMQLGALLANNKAFERVGEYLAPEHFADPVHGRIFHAIKRRVEAGQLADAVTLRAEFEHSGLLDEVGGPAYLAQLLSAMVGVINAGEYGQVIYDAWLRRQLVDLGEVVVNRAFGSEAELDAKGQLESAEQALFELAKEGGAGEGGGRARRVQFVPGRKVVILTLFLPALRADLGAGIDKKLVGTVGTDNGADVTPLHDEGGGKAKLPLYVYEILAQFRQGGDHGDRGVDVRLPGEGSQVALSLPKGDFSVADLGVEIDLGEQFANTVSRRRIVSRFQSQEGEGPVHRTGVHVNEPKILGHETGHGAFTGGGGTVDADHRMKHAQRPNSCSREICLPKPG